MDLLGSLLETPQEWTYRGEGNCNVVISLPKTQKILRIRKTEKPKSLLDWILVFITDIFYWCYGKAVRDEVRDLSFYSEVMRPLLGESYTSDCKQVMLTRKQMQIFKDGLFKKRPESRQNKVLQYERSALFEDFAYLPAKFSGYDFVGDTFAVELKPKQGWRPPKEQNHPSCFFCMNQYLKLEKKQIKSITKYCPEELFSGDKPRMEEALKNLIKNPQNNFKILKNGSIWFDEKHLILDELFQIDDFCDFLQNCLTTDLDNDCKDCKCEFSNKNPLPKGSVLNRILSLQMLDSQGTHSTYKKLTKCDMWEDFSFVDKFLDILRDKKGSCIKCLIADVEEDRANELMFLPYLVSAIAKDCSLMITFRELRTKPWDAGSNVFETKFGTFLVHIGVFDLYPKPLSTIQKHYKRNRDIFRALKKWENLTKCDFF